MFFSKRADRVRVLYWDRDGYVGLDATSIRVLDMQHPLGLRTGALWLLQGDHCYSYFLYAESGHAHHLEAKLKGYKLASVMCDGSATNNIVERCCGERGGCNAHARRKLAEALRGGDSRALQGLELFARIFHVDAESKRASETLQQRFERRTRQSAPVVAELEAWVKARRADVEPKSALGKAVAYIHRQWLRLTRFLRDARMELSNNEVESGLRTWVLNRKTWLFCGHDVSSRRAHDHHHVQETRYRPSKLHSRHAPTDTRGRERPRFALARDTEALAAEPHHPDGERRSASASALAD